jgi:hypothetical protein
MVLTSFILAAVDHFAFCVFLREAIMDVQAVHCTARPVDHDTFGVSVSPSPLELASSYIGLPPVEIDSLEEIRDKILSAFPSQKEVYASIILDEVMKN